MRHLSFYTFLILSISIISCFYSCTDSKTKENTSVTLSPANWNDTTTMGKVINDYYRDSVFEVKKIAMELKDPFMKSLLPYRYVQLQKVLRPRLKVVSPTKAFMPVLMTEIQDSVIVDFQIEWKQLDPNDSTGTFIVTDQFIQKVGTEFRYEWIQEGEYWIRKNIDSPKDSKNK